MKYNFIFGIFLSLVAAFAYSSQAALIKLEATSLPSLPVVIFIQSLVSLMLILPIILKQGLEQAREILTTHRIKLHLLRTLCSLGISFLLFYAVTYIPLVNSMLLANTAPLMLPFLGYFFLSQKINHQLWIPLLTGYIGVAIALHPDMRIFNPASFLALGAAVALASSMLLVRRLASAERTETTTFYFFLLSSFISGLIAIKFWIPFTLSTFLIMCMIGSLYFICQYLSTAALRYINPQLLGFLFYSCIIFAAIISTFLWKIPFTFSTLIGMILIISGGILCIRIESQTNSHAPIKEKEVPFYAE